MFREHSQALIAVKVPRLEIQIRHRGHVHELVVDELVHMGQLFHLQPASIARDGLLL